jgi:hypothetical protein
MLIIQTCIGDVLFPKKTDFCNCFVLVCCGLTGELKELVMSRDIHALPKSNSLAQRLSRLYFHDDSNNDGGECSKSTATESFSATPPSEPDNIAGQENTDERSGLCLQAKCL